jgi:hypothetical protein
MWRHCQRAHCKDAAYLRVDQVPTKKAWHKDWHQIMMNPEPVFVNIEDPESSVSEDRIIDQDMSVADGVSRGEDAGSEQVDPKGEVDDDDDLGSKDNIQDNEEAERALAEAKAKHESEQEIKRLQEIADRERAEAEEAESRK